MICTHTKTVADKKFVCIREDHDWENQFAADHRRAHQKNPINPDRHVMVREDCA